MTEQAADQLKMYLRHDSFVVHAVVHEIWVDVEIMSLAYLELLRK